MQKDRWRPSTLPLTRPPLQPSAFVCVHGHFYQPPRENPWLETVEVQESAAPYHDWNERITSECYAPNGASRITDSHDEIIRIVNNYARMSFNFGPTLLSWLEDKAPRTYRMILDADAASAARYGGHGSAMAQVYNHIIMPLASERDARTQIRWGIADFEHRFGRKPEGMWLAETAVNRNVLDLMAQEGIKFTILAPNQCQHVRRRATNSSSRPKRGTCFCTRHRAWTTWIPTPNATVDPTPPLPRPAQRRPQHRRLLLRRPQLPRHRLRRPAQQRRNLRPSDCSTASPPTRHRRQRRLSSRTSPPTAKATATTTSTARWPSATPCTGSKTSGKRALTNYGEFLEKFPPQWEAEVAEDTSWSCAHGVERWRSNCGCNGGKPGWNQEWRGPLREALDLLRDAHRSLAEAFSASHCSTTSGPPATPTSSVVLDRSPTCEDRFLDDARHPQTLSRPSAPPSGSSWSSNATPSSCTPPAAGSSTRSPASRPCRSSPTPAAFCSSPPGSSAAKAPRSNPSSSRFLRRQRATFPRSATAPKSIAATSPACASASSRSAPTTPSAPSSATIRKTASSSASTSAAKTTRSSPPAGDASRSAAPSSAPASPKSSRRSAFAVLHLGDQNLSAAIRKFDPSDPKQLAAFATFASEVGAAIRSANLPEVIRLIDRFFGGIGYSLSSLFADEQHRILRSILDRTLSEMEDSLRKIYDDHASLLHFLTESGMIVPPPLALAAGYALNAALRHAIEAEDFKTDDVNALLSRAIQSQIALDISQLSYTAGQRMKRAMVRLEAAVSGDDPSTGSALHMPSPSQKPFAPCPSK